MLPGQRHSGRTASTRSAQALLNLFPLPNATTRPAPTSTTTPSRRCRTGRATTRCCAWTGTSRRTPRCTDACSSATRSAPAACRSSVRPAAGRSSRASTRSTRSATSTRCCTPSTRRSSREVTVGVNWAHQYTSAFDEAARDANDRRVVLPGFPQFFPQANPADLLPQATFTGGPPGNDRLVRHRAALAVLRLQHAVELLRQHHQDQGRAQHEGGPVRRAHDAPGAARRRASTARSASTPTGRTRSTPTSGSPTRCSAPSRSTRSRTAIRTAHGQFMNTEWYVQDNWRVKQNFTIDAGVRFYYITPTQSEGDEVAVFEPERLAGQRGAAAVSSRSRRRRVAAPSNPVDRRDPAAGLPRAAGAGLRRLHQRHGGVRRARRSRRTRSSWRRASASRGT